MVARSRELGLRVDSTTDDRKLRVTVMVTTIAMNYVHSRDRRLPGRIPV